MLTAFPSYETLFSERWISKKTISHDSREETQYTLTFDDRILSELPIAPARVLELILESIASKLSQADSLIFRFHGGDLIFLTLFQQILSLSWPEGGTIRQTLFKNTLALEFDLNYDNYVEFNDSGEMIVHQHFMDYLQRCSAQTPQLMLFWEDLLSDAPNCKFLKTVINASFLIDMQRAKKDFRLAYLGGAQQQEAAVRAAFSHLIALIPEETCGFFARIPNSLSYLEGLCLDFSAIHFKDLIQNNRTLAQNLEQALMTASSLQSFYVTHNPTAQKDSGEDFSLAHLRRLFQHWRSESLRIVRIELPAYGNDWKLYRSLINDFQLKKLSLRIKNRKSPAEEAKRLHLDSEKRDQLHQFGRAIRDNQSLENLTLFLDLSVCMENQDLAEQFVNNLRDNKCLNKLKLSIDNNLGENLIPWRKKCVQKFLQHPTLKEISLFGADCDTSRALTPRKRAHLGPQIALFLKQIQSERQKRERFLETYGILFKAVSEREVLGVDLSDMIPEQSYAIGPVTKSLSTFYQAYLKSLAANLAPLETLPSLMTSILATASSLQNRGGLEASQETQVSRFTSLRGEEKRLLDQFSMKQLLVLEWLYVQNSYRAPETMQKRLISLALEKVFGRGSFFRSELRGVLNHIVAHIAQFLTLDEAVSLIFCGGICVNTQKELDSGGQKSPAGVTLRIEDTPPVMMFSSYKAKVVEEISEQPSCSRVSSLEGARRRVK